MSSLAFFAGKILPALALLVTTTVSILLLISRHHLFSGTFPAVVEDSRTAIQVLVQILSFFLAMLQVYVLRTLFGYATRLLLPGRRLNLDKLSLWAAITQGKLDFSLSKQYVLILLTIVALTALPSALWAGALTPILVTSLQVNGTIAVPRFSSSSSGLWDSEFYLQTFNGTNIQVYPRSNCTTIHDERGLIPSCPVPTLQGLLLSSAGTATSTNPDQPRVHAKLDNDRWSYTGRSFGVGSSAGIAQPSFPGAVDAFVGYKYLETGYRPQVQCKKNESSALVITLVTTVDGGFTRYDVYGQLANEPPGTYESFPITSWRSDFSDLLAWAARSYNRSNIITLASGSNGYTSYNQVQCEVTFVPTTFEVSVNLTSKLITAKALPDDAEDFEPTGHLIFNAIQSINYLGRISCNALWVSVIGQTLLQNVWNMQQRLNTTDLSEVAINSAVADSFTAMIDDILVAYGASQLLNANDTIAVTATGMRTAILIGKPIWTYAVFSFNSSVILVFLVELLRTRFWHGLSHFDYTNMKCTIAAVGAAEQMSNWASAGRHSKRWTGDPSDPAFKHMQVVFKKYGSSVTGELNMPLLHPAGSSRSIPLTGLQRKITSHDAVSQASLLDNNRETTRSFV